MGGGGSTTINSQDEAYNARMAAIAEQQQAMAQEYYGYYKDYYQPYEKEQIAANRGLLPYQTGLQQKALIAGAEALDPNAAMDTAAADVAQSFEGAQDSIARNLSKRGVTMDSGQALQLQKEMTLERTKAIGGARTGARRNISNAALGFIGGQQ
jgi:hypothetical protein